MVLFRIIGMLRGVLKVAPLKPDGRKYPGQEGVWMPEVADFAVKKRRWVKMPHWE